MAFVAPQFGDLIEAARILFVLCAGPDHVLVQASPEMLERFGGHVEFGVPLGRALPSLAMPAISTAMDHVYETGEPVELAVPFRLPGHRRRRMLNIALGAHRDERDHVTGVSLFAVAAPQPAPPKPRKPPVGWLRSVIESLPVGVVVVEAASGRLTHNPEAARILGRPVPDQGTFWRALHPDGRTYRPEEDPLTRALRYGELVHQHEMLHGANPDDAVILGVNAAPVRNASGRIIAAVCVFEDHTARAKAEQDKERLITELLAVESRLASAEQELLEANEHLRALIAASPLAIVTMDGNCAVRSWNPAAERIFGWTSAEVIGQIAPHFPESRRRQCSQYVNGVIAGGTIAGIETQAIRKDGGEITVAVSGAPVRTAAGGSEALFILADTTAQKQMEERLRDRQKIESIGRLAGGIAHDFNNLLTGILGGVDLALEGIGKRHRCRPFLESAIRSTQRGAELTRQLLAYSGRGRFVLEDVDIPAVAAEAIELVRSSFSPGIHITLNAHASTPRVRADRAQMQQLITNLLINAGEAVGEGPGAIAVSVGPVANPGEEIPSSSCEPSPSGWYARIEVRDTGCGMDEGIQSRIFDPFFSTKGLGRGLGLAAVQGIVRSHDGLLFVSSVPGAGSSFRVLLPAVEPPRPPTDGAAT
ncbi:MAG TPA: PAS domain S-box protein [Bryobacteraceae bacterium]|nr:PAS domain S-box protein [Bryobacteraceae bacterium]